MWVVRNGEWVWESDDFSDSSQSTNYQSADGRSIMDESEETRATFESVYGSPQAAARGWAEERSGMPRSEPAPQREAPIFGPDARSPFTPPSKSDDTGPLLGPDTRSPFAPTRREEDSGPTYSPPGETRDPSAPVSTAPPAPVAPTPTTPILASDGQSLSDQSWQTQADFYALYKEDAAQRWKDQHEQEIRRGAPSASATVTAPTSAAPASTPATAAPTTATTPPVINATTARTTGAPTPTPPATAAAPGVKVGQVLQPNAQSANPNLDAFLRNPSESAEEKHQVTQALLSARARGGPAEETRVRMQYEQFYATRASLGLNKASPTATPAATTPGAAPAAAAPAAAPAAGPPPPGTEKYTPEQRTTLAKRAHSGDPAMLNSMAVEGWRKQTGNTTGTPPPEYIASWIGAWKAGDKNLVGAAEWEAEMARAGLKGRIQTGPASPGAPTATTARPTTAAPTTTAKPTTTTTAPAPTQPSPMIPSSPPINPAPPTASPDAFAQDPAHVTNQGNPNTVLRAGMKTSPGAEVTGDEMAARTRAYLPQYDGWIQEAQASNDVASANAFRQQKIKVQEAIAYYTQFGQQPVREFVNYLPEDTDILKITDKIAREAGTPAQRTPASTTTAQPAPQTTQLKSQVKVSEGAGITGAELAATARGQLRSYDDLMRQQQANGDLAGYNETRRIRTKVEESIAYYDRLGSQTVSQFVDQLPDDTEILNITYSYAKAVAEQKGGVPAGPLAASPAEPTAAAPSSSGPLVTMDPQALDAAVSNPRPTFRDMQTVMEAQRDSLPPGSVERAQYDRIIGVMAESPDQDFYQSLRSGSFWKPEAYNAIQNVMRTRQAAPMSYNSVQTANTITLMSSTGSAWREDLSPDQYQAYVQGELPYDVAMSACGPGAIMTVLRASGRNPTWQETVDLAAQYGWTQQKGMSGMKQQQNMLQNEFGIRSAFRETLNFAEVDEAIARGGIVLTNTNGGNVPLSEGHYFTLYGKDEQGRYLVGGSGTALRNGSAWMTPEEMMALGGSFRHGLFINAEDMGVAVTNMQTGVPMPTNPLEPTDPRLERTAPNVQYPVAPSNLKPRPIPTLAEGPTHPWNQRVTGYEEQPPSTYWTPNTETLTEGETHPWNQQNRPPGPAQNNPWGQYNYTEPGATFDAFLQAPQTAVTTMASPTSSEPRGSFDAYLAQPGQPNRQTTNMTLSGPAPGKYGAMAVDIASQYEVPPDVALALKEIENAQEDPTIRSSAGAIGLLQVMPFHFAPGEDPEDPATNMHKGYALLARKYREYGSWDKAAAAYFGALDSQGNITEASDGGTTGGGYVRLFNQARARYAQGY